MDANEAKQRITETLEALSPEDKKSAIATALSFVDPTKPYGPELFNALVPLMPNVAFEGVLFRQDEKGIEILLGQRPANDPDYPNQ